MKNYLFSLIQEDNGSISVDVFEDNREVRKTFVNSLIGTKDENIQKYKSEELSSTGFGDTMEASVHYDRILPQDVGLQNIQMIDEVYGFDIQ